MSRKGNGTFVKKKVDFVISEKGCFECTSHSINNQGYISHRSNGKVSTLHRFIYEEMFGEVPEGMVIRHKCDNRKCINPEHLEIGTVYDNNQDRVARKRNGASFGSGNPKSTINEKVAVSIKRMAYLGISNADISEILEVDKQVVSKVKCGRTWKHTEVGEVVCEE